MFPTTDTKSLADALVRAGTPQDKAEEYVRLIGDDPEIDVDGLLVIRNDSFEIIDRVANPGF